MSYKLYFGVDVSKHWLDIAYYDGEDVDWQHGHIRVDNDEKGFKELGKWLTRLGVGKGTAIFCMEYTGLYCQEFRQWLERQGIVYGMVVPRKMHRFEPDLGAGERALDRVKTDEMDSFRIAIYCKEHAMKIRRKPSRLPSPAYFKLKRLMAERRQYVKQSMLYKQQLHDIGIYDSDSSRCRKQSELDNLTEKVRQTMAEMQTVISEDERIRRNYDLLLSIKGIGPVVAVDTIVLTENFTAIDASIGEMKKQSNHLSVAVENLADANKEIVDSIQTISAITEEVSAHSSETYTASEMNQNILKEVEQIVVQLSNDAQRLNEES